MTQDDPDVLVRRLAAESLAASDPTGWFEHLYVSAREGKAVVPWDHGVPHQLLVRWAEGQQRDPGKMNGREPNRTAPTALIVGCGLGDDAEYVAGLGFDTVAFDVAATAVRTATERFPHSVVRYRTADLLNPPAEWRGAFDLVIESMTVQAVPTTLRREATARVTEFVGPGGSLVVIAASRDQDDEPTAGPPWPLNRTEIEAFGTPDLQPVRINDIRDAAELPGRRWLAEFRRTDR